MNEDELIRLEESSEVLDLGDLQHLCAGNRLTVCLGNNVTLTLPIEVGKTWAQEIVDTCTIYEDER